MRLKWQRNVLLLCAFGALVYLYHITHGFETYFVVTISQLASRPAIEKSPHTKHVLIWTSPKADPIVYLGEGNETFYKRNCSCKDCYVTSDRELFKVTEFDAIVFHAPEIMNMNSHYLPSERSPNQSFIFASMESSDYYKVPDNRYNGFFNFTWTYKLNSDISFAYMIIKDNEGNIVGPNATVPWMSIDDMLPINNTVETKLASKSIAAAWFVSNCKSLSGREKLSKMMIAELNKYNMTVDIYGRCGNKKCPVNSMEKCLKRLQKDYYFYFAFENSFSEDYVTEKLLHGLQNYAVPIVYGAANYERFMPNGIYLSVNNDQSSVAELVNEMVAIIKDREKYHNFFRWHNHYSYHSLTESPDTDPYCLFCSFLNKIDKSKVSVVENLYDWWNPHNK